MAWRFVVQPNGLLARWSDIVDDFTHTDLSDPEALVIGMTCAGFGDLRRFEVETKIEAARRAGSKRWTECQNVLRALGKISSE